MTKFLVGLLISSLGHAQNSSSAPRPVGITVAPATASAVQGEEFDRALQRAADTLEAPSIPNAEMIPSGENVPVTRGATEPVINAEEQVPLNIKPAAMAERAEASYTKMLLGLGVLCVLAGAALFATRKWGQGRVATKNKARMNVVSQMNLGGKKSLMVVHIAGESLLLGITDNNITVLKSLALIDDEVPEVAPQPFRKALRDVEAREEEDEFTPGSINDLKSLVSGRLKGLRSLA